MIISGARSSLIFIDKPAFSGLEFYVPFDRGDISPEE